MASRVGNGGIPQNAGSITEFRTTPEIVDNSANIDFGDPGANNSAVGIHDTVTVGENVAFGDSLYLNTDGLWYKSDANAVTTMPALRMATETKSASGLCNTLAHGKAWNNYWSFSTSGGFVYASTGVGILSQVSPTGVGDQVQIVGIAYHPNKINFNPSTVIVELA